MFELFGYPEFSTSGEKILTTRQGLYQDMKMDIRVYQMQPGKTLTIHNPKDEYAMLLIAGELEFSYQDQQVTVARKGCFDELPYCLHVCRDTKVTVTAVVETELLIQATENDNQFAAKLYCPEDCRQAVAGTDLCGGTALRMVRTIFDYQNAPYSNMVIGEVVSGQGRWSSYIPHHHPQPEVYYYHFDRPQGFGACFIGDQVFNIKDGSFCAIPGGLTHPQAAAPGYRLYTCWMIRHLDRNPWTDRIDDQDHSWMLDQQFD